MTESIGSDLFTLPQIFEDRFFHIPDYQRGYAWTEDQVTDLLKDLEHMRDGQGDDARHYTGTLVLIREGDALRYEIIDGQQRLTTLIIFMSCLARRSELAEQSVQLISRYVKRGEVGNQRYVLQQGSDSREFFEGVILESGCEVANTASSASHYKLLNARKTISHWLDVNHANDKAGLKTLLELAENRLGLLVYEPKCSAEVGVMFEVINNRGRPLTELEKVKNYLIYLASKLNASKTQDKINSKWSGILRNLHSADQSGDGDEHSFLRAATVVFFGLSKKESSSIYYEIKHSRLNLDHIFSEEYGEIDRDEAVKQLEKFIDFLADCSHWYRLLHDGGSAAQGLGSETRAVICRLRAQRQHANILPLFFAVLTKNSQVGPDEERLLRLIEILNFRVYLVRNSWRADWGQGPLYSIAARYWKGGSVSPDGEDWSSLELTPARELERRLVWFTIVTSVATDQHLMNGLNLAENDSFDFARWPGLRYFLISYEEYLNPKKTIDIDQILARRESQKSGDFYSVEHIWAKKHDAGRHDGRKDDWIRRKLGNFCLLELNLNIIGRNRGIDEKVEIYASGKPSEGVQRSTLAQVDEVIRFARDEIKRYGISRLKDARRNGYRVVHEEICKARENALKKFTVQRWSLTDFEGFSEANRYLENIDA